MDKTIQDAIAAFSQQEAEPENASVEIDETPEEVNSDWDSNVEDSPDSEIDSTSVVQEDASDDTEINVSSDNPEGDIVEISVTDDKGRRNVKVDFSDREKLKKLVSQAYGMRKFQRERDEAQTQFKEVSAKAKELETAWNALNDAYERDGIRGLVNLMVEEENAYDKHIQEQVDRHAVRSKASPDELKQLEALERAEQIARENERIRRQLEERDVREAKSREETQVQVLQTKLNAPYAKYSFSGKLGDRELEAHYNEALWNMATNKLRALPEDTDLTDELINSTFRSVALNFQKAVSKQVKEKAAKATQRAKDAAATRVASKARAGIPQQSQSDAFKQNIKSGNWGEALAQAMLGRVKLK